MGYTPIGWQDSPSTSTPIDATNLNHMETGIGNCLQNDGSEPITVTLSGSDAILLDMQATDGKHYQLKIRASDNCLYFYDVTDSKVMFSFSPAQGPTGFILVGPSSSNLPAAGIKNRIAGVVPYTP
jgi:hypothetical protein